MKETSMEYIPSFQLYTLVCGFFLMTGHVTGQSYSNYTDLVSTVLTGYNTDVIPTNDHSRALTISVSGDLYDLLSVDVVLGKISIVFAIQAEWQDDLITWTPSDYGNLEEILIPKKSVWAPSFVLGTPVDFDVLGESWMPATFQSDGAASISLGDVVNSACTFNVEFWPFDKHICDISFVVFGYPIDDIRLDTTSSNNFRTTSFTNENIEWEVTETSMFIREDRGASEAVFRMKIERRSSIFIILILFPLYGMAILNSFVLLLPSEAGERIGFSTTIMLSMTVFLEVISDYIPNTSKPIPLLCVIVTMGIAMGVICILVVILSLHFYHKDPEVHINDFYVKFVKRFNGKFNSSKVSPKSEENGRIKSGRDKGVQRQNDDARLGTDDTDDARSVINDIEITWKDVSYTVDKVCFIMGTSTHGMTILGFTLYLLLGS